jgi:Peroxidase, family 2
VSSSKCHGKSWYATLLTSEAEGPHTVNCIFVGILPHNGRNITFKELNEKVRATFNFAPSFCFFVPNYSARMLEKSYSKDTFDLSDLNLHNGIEHDASLTREFFFLSKHSFSITRQEIGPSAPLPFRQNVFIRITDR